MLRIAFYLLGGVTLAVALTRADPLLAIWVLISMTLFWLSYGDA